MLRKVATPNFTQELPAIESMQELLDRVNREFLEKINSLEENFDDSPKDICVPPLHQAAFIGDYKAVKRFLEEGFDPNEREEMDGYLPLHIAAGEGYINIMQLLLEFESELGTEDHSTPLHDAAEKGKLDAVRFLVHMGLSYDRVNEYGHRPLELAAEEGHMDVLKFLISLGSDPFIKSSFQSSEKIMKDRSALELAICNGHVEVVRFLVELEDIKLVDEWLDLKSSAQHEELKKIWNRNIDRLALAASQGQLEVVKYFILERKFDMFGQTSQGSSIIEEAIGGGNLNVVRFLLNHEPKLLSDAISKNAGYELLCRAAHSSHKAVVKFLIESGVSITWKGSNPSRYLWKEFTEVETRKTKEYSSSYMVKEYLKVKERRLDTVHLLLAYDADVEISISELDHQNGTFLKFESGEAILSNSEEVGEIKGILKEYLENKERRRLKSQAKSGFASEIFSFMPLLCDEYLQIKPTASSKTKRFFEIAKDLPMDLQMVMAHRCIRSKKDTVSPQEVDRAFKWHLMMLQPEGDRATRNVS
jgi:ankyrin repeat protein